jgi:hypothetical protein
VVSEVPTESFTVVIHACSRCEGCFVLCGVIIYVGYLLLNLDGLSIRGLLYPKPSATLIHRHRYFTTKSQSVTVTVGKRAMMCTLSSHDERVITSIKDVTFKHAFLFFNRLSVPSLYSSFVRNSSHVLQNFRSDGN